MRSRLLSLLLWALILSASLAEKAAAQDFGVVRGEVRLIKLDSRGNEISNEVAKGVPVHFTTKFRHSGTLTDEKGTFDYKLTLGDWTIKADVRDYTQPPKPYRVNVSAEKKSTYPILPDPPVKLFSQARAHAHVTPPRISLVLYSIDAPKTVADTTRYLPPDLLADACKPGEIGWRGRVVDIKSKAIPKARVSALGVRKDSDLLLPLRSEITDKSGTYALCFHPTANVTAYVMSVTLEGYDDFLTLLLGGEAPPEMITLDERSSIQEDPLLEKSEATRRHVFSSRMMETLPVAGLRNFDTFALLAPGVAPPPETANARGPGVSPGLGTAGQFSVNGLRSRENNFTVDGSDNNDEDIGARRQGFVALAPQSIESISEFQIITALGDARFGRNIGGQLNALTKSGSLKPHGSFYGFFTDSRLNARDFFDRDFRSDNLPASFELERQSDGAPVLLDGVPIVTANPVGGENPLTRIQLGTTATGQLPKLPVPLFVSLERLILHASRESHFIVPTVEQRGMFDAGATGLLLTHPAVPPLLPIFPTSMAGNAIFSLYPFPNNPLGPFGRNTYTTVLPADAKATRLSIKIEHQFGHSNVSKRRMPWSLFRGGDTLTARYNFSQETSIVPVTGEALSSSLRPNVRTKNIAFYLNRLLTRRISDVIRFSVGHTSLNFEEVRDPRLRASATFPDRPFLLNAPLLLNVTKPPFQPSFATPAAFGLPGFSQAEQITGPLGQIIMPGFSPVGVDVNYFPQARANTLVQIADTVTYAHPEGQIFTFGIDVRKTLINSTLDRDFAPVAVFGSLRTSSPVPNFFASLPGGTPLTPQVFSGATLAAAGVPVGLFQTLAVNPDSTVGIRFTQVSFFAQDDWRARSNLNINLGVRFNRLTRLTTKRNKLENAFDLDELRKQSEDCINDHGIRPICENIMNATVSAFPADFGTSFGGDKRDLDVRTGLAWMLNDRTVVRGGFGIYSGELPGIVVGESRNAFPNFVSLNVADFPSALSLARAGGIRPDTLNTLNSTNAISYLTALTRIGKIVGLDLVVPQKELTNPYSLQYAVTLERQLSSSYALSVAYVGTRGLKLLRISTPNLGSNRSGLSPDPMLAASAPFPLLTGGLVTPQMFVPSTKLAISRTLYESSASSSYNSLQIELRKHYAHRFQVRTAFTYSHAIDDVSDFFDMAGASALPQNSLARSERASSNFDLRIRSLSYFVQDFPKDWIFFGGKRFGGWQFSGIVTAQTGQPFTVNSAFDTNHEGNFTDRLNTTMGLIRGSSTDRSVQLSLEPGTNPLSLLAEEGRDGSVGRNTFRAPGQFTFDLSITKFLNFNDRYRLQARTEIFNLFNRINFGIPVRILESPGFGRSTYTTTPPRTVQIAVKLLF